MRNLPAYETFIGESGLSKAIGQHLEVERVRNLVGKGQTLSDVVSYFMDASDDKWDEDEATSAIKTWARKHDVQIKESVNESKSVEQVVDVMVRDLVKMGADEKTARGMYQPADASAFKGYAVEGMRSRKHRRGVAWTTTVTKDGKPVCGVRQGGDGSDNSYDVIDRRLYAALEADAKRAFPKDFEALGTFVAVLDSMTNESAVNEGSSTERFNISVNDHDLPFKATVSVTGGAHYITFRGSAQAAESLSKNAMEEYGAEMAKKIKGHHGVQLKLTGHNNEGGDYFFSLKVDAAAMEDVLLGLVEPAVR